MLSWAAVLFLAAIAAAAVGFGDRASTAGMIAQILFFILVVLFVALLVARLFRGAPEPRRRGGRPRGLAVRSTGDG